MNCMDNLKQISLRKAACTDIDTLASHTSEATRDEDNGAHHQRSYPLHPKSSKLSCLIDQILVITSSKQMRGEAQASGPAELDKMPSLFRRRHRNMTVPHTKY
jgi:hypothetical protein